MNIIRNAMKNLVRVFAWTTACVVLASPMALAGTDNQQTQTDEEGLYGEQENRSPQGQDQDMGQDQEMSQQPQRGQQGQQGEQGQQGTEAQMAISIDGQTLRAEDLRDRDVVNAQGEEIGSVSDVVTDGEETAIVVGAGGILGFGGTDVLVSTDEIRVEEDRVVWETSADEETLKDMPEYDEDRYISIE